MDQQSSFDCERFLFALNSPELETSLGRLLEQAEVGQQIGRGRAIEVRVAACFTPWRVHPHRVHLDSDST